MLYGITISYPRRIVFYQFEGQTKQYLIVLTGSSGSVRIQHWLNFLKCRYFLKWRALSSDSTPELKVLTDFGISPNDWPTSECFWWTIPMGSKAFICSLQNSREKRYSEWQYHQTGKSRNSKPQFSSWWQMKQMVVFCGSAVNQTCPHIWTSHQLVLWDWKEHIQLLPAISQNAAKNVQLLMTCSSSPFICNGNKSVSSYQ